MIVPRLLAFVFGFAVVAGTFAQQRSPQHDNPPRLLVADLVSVLNSKDEVKMRRFVKNRVIPNAPVEQRVSRWMDLATHGAPFKVVRDLAQTDEKIAVVMVDKLANRIAMTVHFESKPNLMMVGIELAPAVSLEGAAPDLASWTSLRSLSVALAQKSKSPAMGIAVVRNGVTEVAVTGVRDVTSKNAVLPEDIWSVGSIGKSICSSVIGKLIEQRKLAWEETLVKALPGTPMNPAYGGVTLDQIMHHRGGIPEDLGFSRQEVQRIVGDAKTPSAIRDRYARDILKRKPAASPNSRFVYSNAGYALLSHIAEVATGKPYELLVRELVFKPLALTHSYIGGDILPKGRPSGHVDRPNGLTPENMSGPMESMFAGAGGGIFMSVGDLAKFGQAHLAGLRGHNGFLAAATISRLHHGLPEQPGSERQYACGWGIESLPGVEPFHGHNGSNGTMRVQLAIFPRANLVVAAAVNRGGDDEPAPGLEAVLAIASRYAHR